MRKVDKPEKQQQTEKTERRRRRASDGAIMIIKSPSFFSRCYLSSGNASKTHDAGSSSSNMRRCRQKEISLLEIS